MNKEYSPFLRTVMPYVGRYVLYPRTHFIGETKTIIKDSKKFLENHPDVSLMLYGNHIAIDDPFWEGYFSYKLDPGRARDVFALVSASHTETKEGEKESEEAKMNKLPNKCGVKTIPVVQTYQVNNEEYGFTQGDAYKYGRNLINQVKEMRGEDNKALTAIIKIEGTRSKDGILGRGEKGTEHIIEMIKPVLIMPVGIIPRETLSREDKNYWRRFDINVGEPVYYDGGDRSVKDTDNLMNNLALVLPPEMRGQYK